MSLFNKLFGKNDDLAFARPLYAAVVAQARVPHWYVEGEVADSVDGRFEMVSVILALVLIALEGLGDSANLVSARLTEVFVEDMDGQMRESGMGDVVVGKHIGKMMSALGGRLGAYRDALNEKGTLEAALVRNLYRGIQPLPGALIHVDAKVRALHIELSKYSLDDFIVGRVGAA